MWRRFVSVAVVCAVAFACYGIAYGAAVKIRQFEIVSQQEVESADAMAILNYASGSDKTIVQIIMSDFTPNIEYMVGLANGPADYVWTDNNGHATVHLTYDGDWSDSKVYIMIDWPYPRCDEIRAVGCNPNDPDPCP